MNTSHSQDDAADACKRCRHITYIQSSFLAKALKLEHAEVVNEQAHRCFVPSCQTQDLNELKVFFTMGNPPVKTYHPINYIGIGLHHASEANTDGWYTAYVPIHTQSYGDDMFRVSSTIIRLIGEGSFWLPGGSKQRGQSVSAGDVDSGLGATENEDGDIMGAATYGGPANPMHSTEKSTSKTGHVGQPADSKEDNVFRLPFPAIGITDPNRYVFATPSCMYATMPELASPLNFAALPVNFRVLIEVLVKPGSFTAAGASLPSVTQNFDCCFASDAIEWYVDDLENIIPRRLLFRILKKGVEQVEPPARESPIKPPSEPKPSQPTVESKDTKDQEVNLITVMPATNLLFVNENNFQALRGVLADNASTKDAVVFQEINPYKGVDPGILAGVSPSRAVDGSTSPLRSPVKGSTSPLRNMLGTSHSPLRGGSPREVVGPAKDAGARDSEVLTIKLKWTEHNNKVIFYLKSLINTKWLEWDGETKLWRVHRKFMYECVKFCLFLGLRVSDAVLFALYSWLRSIDMRGVGEVFLKAQLVHWLNTNKIWSFQRVCVRVVPGFNPAIHKEGGKGVTPAMNAMEKESAETIEIHLIPYNKDIVARFKERNAQKTAYVWQKSSNCWITDQLVSALEDLMAVMPNLREACKEDTYLSSRGINLRDLNRTQKRNTHGDVSVPLKRAMRSREEATESDDDEFCTVTKMIITAAGKEPHLMRLKNKIKTVVEKVQPPSSSISSTGKVIFGGAGTGGIEFVEVPRGCDAWNKVSLCVVPDEHEGEVPVDRYDPNLLASLIGEVFIVKESVMDYLVTNFKRWPGPHDTVAYTRWNQIVTRNEPRCWGGLSFDGRQSLAQSRLFCDEDFYISGANQNSDATFCALLIQLGNGKIVDEASNAEYVVITDRMTQEAQDLSRKFANNDEDLIANTHGARHSTLVTPKYIYDCILDWRLQRPSRGHGHMAF